MTAEDTQGVGERATLSDGTSPDWSSPDVPTARWILIGISACVIAPAALFIHDFMLESLRVPYPKIVGLPVWATGLNVLTKLLTIVAFCKMSRPTLERVSPLAGAFAMGFLMLMLHETGRVIVIEHSIYDSWAVAFIDGAPAAIALFLEISIVTYAYLTRIPWQLMAALIATVTIVGAAVLSPWLVAHFGSVRDVDFKDVKELYSDPYPPFLNVIIYTTFAEPTVAAFAFAMLCWQGLSGPLARRVALFTLLLLLVRGRFSLELVSSFYVQLPLKTAFLATGQFFLETLILGLLVGAAWGALGPRHVVASRDP